MLSARRRIVLQELEGR